MRPLVALFVLFLVAAPFLPVLDHAAPIASADSFAIWNKVFHLHDGARFATGTYDWMNSSGPVNPSYIDYDGDSLPGITIKKNVPPQRYHAWQLYPPVNTPIDLSGELGAYIWAKSQGNESGTIIEASFLDITPSQFSDPFLGTLIGSTTSPLTGPFYSEFQLVPLVIPSVTYTLPAGHLISLAIQRGDSINDWLIVHFDRNDYDSFVILTSDKFISMNAAWTEDAGGVGKSLFSDLEDIYVDANVSDPFGSSDIQGANVTVFYASNQTVVVSMQPLTLLDWDHSAIPYWKSFRGMLPKLDGGLYVANVTAMDTQGYPSWLNVSFKVVSVDHFGVVALSIVVAGSPFPLNISALNSSDQIVTDWIGTVQLSAYRTDKVLLSNGTLSNTSVQFTSGNQGQVNISDETYGYAEEQIYIKATAGPRFGWSGLITVRSGTVTGVDLVPPGPLTLNAGANQSFSAIGRDILGNLNSSWSPYWSVTSSIGTVTPSGLSATFFAVGVGSGNLTCANNLTGASANVSITVVPGGLVRINISSPAYPLVVQEGESVPLTATGYDASNNTVSIAGASWDTTTSGTMTGSGPSATFKAGYVPGIGLVECRLGSVIGSLSVQVIESDIGPSLDTIPPQIRSEDTESWEYSLTNIWHDVNGTSGLFWWVEDVNYSLYFILHEPDNNAMMQFYTQPDQFGEDQFTLWVIDSDGYRDYVDVTVKILPINDKPVFVNHPPTELYVAFNTEYTFDYTYYVSDVDNSKEELSMSSDGDPNVWFDWLAAHFNYSGQSSYFKIVKMYVQDASGASSEMSIVVKVTKDNPPSLNASLPDLVIDEGVLDYYAFDLDDYFYDIDSSVLIYSTGFENIPAPFINSTTHRVYFSTPGEWSGLTEGTFTATDPDGALKTDTMTVTVIAVNDPPTINPIETVYVRYLKTYYLYLSPYVFDPDNSMESLVFQINDTHVVRGVSMTGADRLEILFPANLSGPVFTDPYRVRVRMNVTDPLGETASVDFEVYVTDNEPPQVISENPDQLYFTFPEDTYLNSTLLLYDLIADQDDATLNFTITSTGSDVHWVIEPSGYVSLSASENWSGMETLNITGKDDSNAWAFVQIFVVVTPVNDAPVVVNPLKDMIVTGGPRNTQYDISAVFFDSDNEDLVIVATPGVNAQVVGHMLFVSLPSGTDVITITLQANDGEFTSSLVIFKVGVRKTIAERIGYPFTLPLVLLAAGVAGYFVGSRLPRPYALENLFLIHNDGRLVAHVTKEENTTLDKDVVSAMFTAVQEFVRDSFQKGEVGLKKLEIGDKNVMIEKGKSAYLALIYSGWPQKEVFDMLPVLLRDIEERYKDKIEKWNGTMKAVPGVDKMLQEYMASAFKPGSWHEEEEIAEEEWVDILNKEA
jgi:hypothetical protein